MPRYLTLSERRVQGALEPHLGRLVPVEETHEYKTPDFRTDGDSDAVEVKQLTSEAYRKVTAVHGAMESSWDLAELESRWTVIDMAPTMSDTHAPVPLFADVDQATIDHYAALGMRVKTRAERVADFHDEATRPRPRIRLYDLGPRLESHLAVLEQHGVTEVDSYPIGPPESVWRATAEIRREIHGSNCWRRDTVKGQRPGLDVLLALGSVRTNNPDTVAQRVELWFDRGGSHVTNLVQSLEREKAGTVRHAALVLDAHEEPEYQAAVARGTEFVPTMALDLPGPIDVLRVVLGPVACRYTAEDGWRAFDAPAAGDTP